MLSAKRPTASTVEYTVSTRCEPKSFASYICRLLLAIARVFGIIVVVLILSWQYEQLNNQPIRWLNRTVADLVSKALLPVELSGINHLSLLALCSTITWLVFRRGYVEESLLVVRGLGVQTSTSSSSYLLTSSTRFISMTAIQDIFIHEAFIGFQVRYYLSIVVENEDKVVVVFPVSELRSLQI